jgi:hypothetical protein
MSKNEKLLERMLSTPKDFTWDELVRLLAWFGYNELKKGKAGGSRRKFADAKKNVIILHEAHPEKTVKQYVIRQVLEHLYTKGYIKHE